MDEVGELLEKQAKKSSPKQAVTRLQSVVNQLEQRMQQPATHTAYGTADQPTDQHHLVKQDGVLGPKTAGAVKWMVHQYGADNFMKHLA
ncbi:hypothetical protein [Magnetococcus sp. PR-3]|uniref:hypothetical protein n=1 Tax=Magnetococcus sp. PR-3 TaxID=3120355 RepID=UPI002FCE267E